METTSSASTKDASPAQVGFAEAFWVWARIGWLSFGGPAGQIALMHRELVERRGWISNTRFMQALNFCMLLPGPEAQQLAVYIGWLMHRVRGGVVAGAMFVLPGMLVLGVLSWVYVRYGNASIVMAAFFGLKAAMLAVVVEAVLRIGRRALTGPFDIVLAACAFIAIHAFDVPFPWVVVIAGAIGMVRGIHSGATASTPAPESRRFIVDTLIERGEAAHLLPSWRRALRTMIVLSVLWFTPVLSAAWWLGADHVVTREGWFFSRAAVVTFGGAYAVLAYVAQRAVEDFRWLRPGEMVDGLALAETTPGPLIMVLQFVGFVAGHRLHGGLDPWVAAVLGALMTTWVTFLPSFLFVLVGGPFVESLRRQPTLQAALSAITAAVVGVVLNLSVWFATHTIFRQSTQFSVGRLRVEAPVLHSVEPMALAIAIAALVATLRFKVGIGWVLAGSTLLGALYWFIH